MKYFRRQADAHQNVAALGRVLGAGQADRLDLADLHAAEFHRRADVQPLHRFVDVSLDHDFFLKNRADAEDDHADRAEDRRRLMMNRPILK